MVSEILKYQEEVMKFEERIMGKLASFVTKYKWLVLGA